MYTINSLEEHIISSHEYQGTKEYYIKEVFNSLSADQVAILPFPQLELFFTSLCRPYIKKLEVIAAIAAEMLVDGMDIDEMCCRRCFDDPEQAAELNFALKLAWGKVIADFAFHTE
ncbi:hypothetical protein PAAG_07922 [Paracoccidioides lutzii Pb01]|uniref:Uncharacterized protein n=1 Tax=Paracoccidioides lutzii (strain ATCC MYA-826 / Pb01) TaxID=502779 RepID=C1HAU3_PARBA|nr:hypothetical protein PAAG_07922 [Paracoccidioides lutzii Pb01]EEH37504.1 hypothetical protein PAAG_07922 [Paracoccidioides lutzii Pb01]